MIVFGWKGVLVWLVRGIHKLDSAKHPVLNVVFFLVLPRNHSDLQRSSIERNTSILPQRIQRESPAHSPLPPVQEMLKRKAETNKDESNKTQHTARGRSPALSNGFGVLEGKSDEDLDSNGFIKGTTPEISKFIRLLLRYCLISGSISPPFSPAAAEETGVQEGSPHPEHQWSESHLWPIVPLPPLPFMHPTRVRERKRWGKERRKILKVNQPLRWSEVRHEDH
jgi:hypothetical protein